jgi:acetoin utilization protein AcuB
MPLSMLTKELPSQTLPFLHLHDKVYQALQMMSDNHVTHLPIEDTEKYKGLVSEDDLLLAGDDTITLAELKENYSTPSVKDTEHFLKAMKVAVDNGISVVPVVDESNELTGVITYADLLKYAAEFMSLSQPGGLIVLEVEGREYSFGEISRIVESNDAQITQLNTSVMDPETGLTQVTIKINKLEISDIVASFQRHEYNVKYYFGEELYENELRTNYDNLMNYLKI